MMLISHLIFISQIMILLNTFAVIFAISDILTFNFYISMQIFINLTQLAM